MSKKQWKKVGVEVSYPVIADMFENPENDWLATDDVISVCRRAGIPKKASHDDALGSRV